MDYLDWLFNDNKIVQLTHQESPHNNSRWKHGRFDNKESLIHEAKRLQQSGNLFVSLNRPLNCEVTNTVDSDIGFKNEDMERRTRLFIDLDPARSGYVASTDRELALATDRQKHAEHFFRSLGWSRPGRAMSGNGAHLIFRTAIPNTDEFNQMIAVIYKGLQSELSTDDVKLDVAVKNIGRIHPLYGTVKRKGTHTEERPFRKSKAYIPEQWQQVRPQQIEYLAEHYAGKAKQAVKQHHKPANTITGKGDYRSLDAVAWFRANASYIQITTNPIKHWVLCPWHNEHSGTGKTDTCLYTDSEIPTFACSHDHCVHRNIFDVIALFGDADSYCSREWNPEVDA